MLPYCSVCLVTTRLLLMENVFFSMAYLCWYLVAKQAKGPNQTYEIAI